MTAVLKARAPFQNGLLDALPADEQEILRPHLEFVALRAGEIVHEASEPRAYLYFPLDCVIALVYTTLEGVSAEVALVGNEGAVGVALFMGGVTTPRSAIVRIPGHAFRLNAAVTQRLFHEGRLFQDLLLRYTQALIAQISQTALCNRFHTIEQQLCRWLLYVDDRTQRGELTVTQELIAGILGVRREGVTKAATHLQRLGIINYSRGHLHIIDRAGLEKTVCECYEAVRKEFDRLLP